MRFLYLGLPVGALCLAARGHLPGVVGTWHLDAPGHRRLRRRLAGRGTLLLGRPDLADASVQEALRSARPDVLLSWFWPRRIPPEVLALPRVGSFGVHPSLLPRWRGPDPTFHAIRAGDRETGVTLHRLAADYDTGAVVAQRRVPVRPTWTGWDLARALDRPGLSLLMDAADRLAAGETLPGTPQGPGGTEAPIPGEEELAIDWSRPADEVLRLIRAAAPDPGATTMLGDRLVEVLEGAAHDGVVPPGLGPAEAFPDPDDGRLVVVAGDRRGITLTAVRLEDGQVVRGAEVRRLVPPS